MADLTPRHKQVATMLAQGKRPAEIAEELGIAQHTVETYRFHIYRALGIDNIVDLVHMAIARGWTPVKGARGRPRKER